VTMASDVHSGQERGRKQPLVSVIIPTSNREWSLRRTVESVFRQTYRPIECLVVDDGCTDETPRVMRRSLCLKAGPWREDDLHGQEHEYFARLNGLCATGRVPGPRDRRA
jgi:hypothetical protein